MTIGHAVQRGTLIYVYDLQGKQITSISAPGRWPGDGLKSFDANTIHVQKGTLLYAYDEYGRQISHYAAVQTTAVPHPGQTATALPANQGAVCR